MPASTRRAGTRRIRRTPRSQDILTGLENPVHLLILLLLVLLLFGAKRLPEMGRSLGQGVREFKSGILGRHAPEEKRGLPETD
jgi:sec-independent protein translocase protein TatA